MLVVTLSKDQKQALTKINKFLQSKEQILTIIGSAGSGKTFLMKYLIDDLIKTDYVFTLCAPTHRACMVLSEFTDCDVFTLHKLLSLQPRLNILALDFKDLKFHSKSNANFPTEGVIIVDEASMVSDDLYSLLEERIKEFNLKIIFIGDAKQLAPVKDKSISKVFDTKNTIKLSTNHRQGENDLIKILDKLRSTSIKKFENINDNLHVYNNAKNFIIDILPYYKELLENHDIKHVKLLAFTNARVKALNDCIRRCLFKDKKMFHKSEILMCYENFTHGKFEFWNSMDYVIVNEPVRINKLLPEFGVVDGYELTLYDAIDKKNLKVFILSESNSNEMFTQLAQQLEYLRLNAVTNERSNKTRANFYWRKYFKLVNSFATFRDLVFDNRIVKKKTFDYGYAITTHRSQGSTINIVCVDMCDINRCVDQSMLRQLQYVSLSRTRNKVYLLE